MVVTAQAWAAFFYGLLSAVSLVIGAVIGVAWRPPQRFVAGIMAFGAGALLSALAFELVLKAYEESGFTPVGVGGIIGGLGFILLNEVVNGQGGFLRKQATTAPAVRRIKQRMTESILSQFSGVELFRAMSPEEVQAIIPHVEEKRYAEGTAIFRIGDMGDALYVIKEGRVDVLADGQGSGPAEAAIGEPTEKGDDTNSDNEGRIARLGPGEAFGEMALLTGEPRSASAVAATEVSLWAIPKDDFDQLVATSPRLALAVSQLLARRLGATTARQVKVEAEARLWRETALRHVETHTLAPSPLDIRKVAQEQASKAPVGIFLGLFLDGIPESLVIGMIMIGAPTVSVALLASLFISNLPEAMSSAVGMKAQGSSVARILGMWTALMVFTGVGAFFGNALFVDAPHVLIGSFEAAAAGAMLCMIAITALPEAYEQGGWLSGIATLLGFLAAFVTAAAGTGPVAHLR